MLPCKNRNRRQRAGTTSRRCSSASTGARSAASPAAVAGCAALAWLLVAWRSTGRCGACWSRAPSSASRRRRSRRPCAEVARGGLASVDLDEVRERDRAHRLGGPRASCSAAGRTRCASLVVEQVAAARWNDTGLLNARGELFLRNARYVPPELPLLEGPDGSEGIGRAAVPRRAGPAARGRPAPHRRAARRARRLGTRSRQRREACGSAACRRPSASTASSASRARWSRKRAAEIGYVDMRYTNGFSVGWNARSALAVAPQEDATPDG